MHFMGFYSVESCQESPWTSFSFLLEFTREALYSDRLRIVSWSAIFKSELLEEMKILLTFL